MKKTLVSKSKFLSLVLRHKPEQIGLELDPQGWASLDELLHKSNASGMQLNMDMIREIVATNDKKRFAISSDGKRIRASQGHSIDIDLQLERVMPPETLFHGTAEQHISSIEHYGIRPAKRQHVHLSQDTDTAMKVGQRHGKPVVFTVYARKMSEQGFIFYLSENNVWLTEHVPSTFIRLDT